MFLVQYLRISIYAPTHMQWRTASTYFPLTASWVASRVKLSHYGGIIIYLTVPDFIHHSM